MFRSKFKLDSIGGLAIAGLPALVLIIISNLNFNGDLTKANNLYMTPPQGIEHFTLGFNGIMADSMWIRVLQDFDYCENKVGRLLCEGQGWVYHLINSISYIDPHFRIPLFTGGLVLTVVVNDKEGASKIFDRAVELYPNDWPILYEAGYQALFIEKNKPKAAQLLERAGNAGAPKWVYALSAKMYTLAGEREYAERLYQSLKDSGATEEILKPVRDRLLGKGPKSRVLNE